MDRLRLHDEIDTVSPQIHGHFAEHLGRCIYDGFALDPDHDYDNPPETIEGTDLRADTHDLLREVGLPLLRWPGGCFADDYHWRHGIGEDRPRRRNLFWSQGRTDDFVESNAFGTEEFIRSCEELNAEPYLSANVGSGNPTEAADWAEYCNGTENTEPVNTRRENGNDEPHGVRYWGIGNENWGCGGDYTPAGYAEAYRRFATYLTSVDDNLSEREMEFIACGHISDDWNRDFLASLGDRARLDNLSVHRYYEAGEVGEYDEEDHFRLFARADRVAEDVDDCVAALDAYGHRNAGVIVDEWGVWHPQAVPENGLDQKNTVRDALTAASVLDDLQARADRVSMANIAQTVNVLQCLVETDAETAWTTPTYHVFDAYAPHRGSESVRTELETDAEEVTADGEDREVTMVSASVTRDDGLYATLSNRDFESRTVEIEADPEGASAEAYFADLPAGEFASPETSDSFGASEHPVENDGDSAVVEIPANAVVAVDLPEA